MRQELVRINSIDGADHLYTNKHGELENVISSNI